MSAFKSLLFAVIVLACLSIGALCQGGGYGSSCSIQAPCQSNFSCIESRCACHLGYHQVYNTSSHPNTCVSLVTAPCVAAVDGQSFEYPCQEGAECSNDILSECVCKQGYAYNSPDMTCKALIGSSCKKNSDCLRTQEESDKNPICKDDICSCPTLDVYDGASGKCRGLVGSWCFGKNNNTISEQCIERADCDLIDYFDRYLYRGVCRCRPGYMPTADRTCQ